MALFRACEGWLRFKGNFRGKLPLQTLLKFESTLKSSLVRSCFNATKNSGSRQTSTTVQWIIAGGGIVTAKLLFDLKIAKCEARVEEPLTLQKTPENLETVAVDSSFPWTQFLMHLLPHAVALSIALVTAVAVAIMNTQIGLSIGSLVNVLSNNLPSTGGSGQSFFQQVKEPAVKLAKLYASHALMTFAYIYSLAVVGE